MPRSSYIRTPEILKKQSEAQKGRPARNKGITLSLERRKEISELTKKAMTPERCLKISLSKIGKKMPEGTGKKISLANRGKTKGNKHYNWKGGKVELGNQIRKCFEYR